MKYILILLVILTLVSCGSESNGGIYSLDEDLVDIADIIGEKDVIIIAEPTHFSEDINEITIEMINTLNENLEYNIIGIETSAAELEYHLEYSENTNLENTRNEAVVEKYRGDIFSQFFTTPEDSINSFTLKGIDWLPITYNRSTDNTFLLEEIFEDVKKYDLEQAENFKNAEINLRKTTNSIVFGDEDYLDFEKIESIKKEYENIKESEYYKKLMPGSQYFIEKRLENLNGPFSKEYLEDFDIDNPNQDYYSRRGKGMYEEISSLVEEGYKVVVWVHNWHALKNPKSINIMDEEWQGILPTNHYSLGYFLEQSTLDTYIIGTIFNGAQNFSSFYLEDENLEKMTDESFLEGKLSTYGETPFFIELEKNEDMSQKYRSYHEGFIEYELVPQEQFDAIVYIDYITN